MKIIKKHREQTDQNKIDTQLSNWKTDVVLNQLAEVIYHSFFKKYPLELQRISNEKEQTNYLKAA